MTNKYFEVERITNGASGEKRTTKIFKDEEKAIAYAKRYHRTTKTIKSVKTTVYYFNGTDTGITYRANTKDGTEKDYRASEQKQATEVKPEQKYNFYITDYTEDRELPTFYEGYTKKEITNMVKEWSEKNNHVYKIYIYDRTSDKGIAGRVFFKVINWKQIYKVGKTGSRLCFGGFSYEEAEKYCKEYAEKDGIAYTIYEVKLDEYGRDDTVQVINIEPPEKIVYYGVRGYSHTFDTLDEAQTFAKNQRSKSELIIYKAIEIDNGLRTTLKQVDVIPAYGAKQHTHYELEIEDKPGQTVSEVKPEPEPTPKIKTLQDWEKKGGNFTDFCKVGDKVDKGIVDYFVDVLPPITWRTDLVQCGEPYGHRDNPKTGRWEAMYITFAKNDNGQWYYAGIGFLNQREAIA